MSETHFTNSHSFFIQTSRDPESPGQEVVDARDCLVLEKLYHDTFNAFEKYKILNPAPNPEGKSCSICNWTNSRSNFNIGLPGEPKWICHGCVKRMAEYLETLKEECNGYWDALRTLALAKEEKIQYGDNPVYQALKRAAWAAAYKVLGKDQPEQKQP